MLEVTDLQLYLAIGVPMLFNLGGFALLYSTLSRQISTEVSSLRAEMNARFEAWHQALLRVEGVLDARLKHLEDR